MKYDCELIICLGVNILPGLYYPRVQDRWICTTVMEFQTLLFNFPIDLYNYFCSRSTEGPKNSIAIQLEEFRHHVHALLTDKTMVHI